MTEEIKNKDIPMPPLPEETPKAEEQEAPETEQQEEKQPEQKEQQSDFSHNSPEKNLRAMREEKERIEQEHQEALKRLAEYEKQRETAKPEQAEEDLDIQLADDDLFEGKHYKKLQKQLKKQQEEFKKYQEQVKLTSTEAKLKSQYSDFDSVVNDKNIRELRTQEPELAETIASTKDMYSKAVAAYKMIKKLGIYVEDNFQQERKIAQANSLKPKPLASVSPQKGDSPLSQANAFANGLTPELKRQLVKEMRDSIKKGTG